MEYTRYLNSMVFTFTSVLCSQVATVTNYASEKAKTGLPKICYCNVPTTASGYIFRLNVHCGSFMRALYFTVIGIFISNTISHA